MHKKREASHAMVSFSLLVMVIIIETVMLVIPPPEGEDLPVLYIASALAADMLLLLIPVLSI